MSTPTNGVNREPIFWAHMNEEVNKAERQTIRIVNGKRIVEKRPQMPHIGDYEVRVRAPGQRYIIMVKEDGNVVPIVHTCAAADLNMGSGYANSIKQKSLFLGRFPLAMCPCAMMMAGTLRPNTVVSDEVREGTACARGTHSLDKPCPHALAELAARREQHNAVEHEITMKYREEEERKLAAQREMNKELLEGVATSTANAVAAAMKKPAKGDKGE